MRVNIKDFRCIQMWGGGGGGTGMIEERQGYNSYKKSTSRTRCRLRNYSVRNTHVEHKTNIQTYTNKDKIPKNLFNFDYFYPCK